MSDYLLSLISSEIGFGVCAGIAIVGWLLNWRSTESFSLYGWRALFIAMQWIGVVLVCVSLVGMVLGAGKQL